MRFRSKKAVGGLPLVCTVSTVKDTADRLLAFVQRNLAAGADHMFLFVDDADADVHAALAAHPHVTAVRTGRGYWRGARPTSLNVRQHVNANRVNVALASVPTARWLFHLDGDECLHLDRPRLMALGDDVDVVRLSPWEALSRMHWDGPVTLYKRPLQRDELVLLRLLGALRSPPATGYFRGHRRGKVGIRPRLDVKLAVHRAERLDRTHLAAFTAEWLHLLHDESFSSDEFVRKWLDHATRPGSQRRGAFKSQLQAAVSVINANPSLDEAAKRELLVELYVRYAQDDEETLDRLGFLERPDPEWHRHRPRPLSEEESAVIDEQLERLRDASHTYFMCGERGRPPGELVPGSAGAAGV